MSSRPPPLPNRTNGGKLGRTAPQEPKPADDEELPTIPFGQRVSQWLATAWKWVRLNPGWGVSIALHTLGLLMVGAWVVHQELDLRGMGIQAMFGEHEQAAPFETIGIEADVEVATSENQVSSISTLTKSGGDAEFGGEISDLLGGAGRGSGEGEGDESGGVADPGLGAAFFGSQGAGKTFIYIVDMSGSMYGARFERARKELISSIEKLNGEQSFHVFFFSDQTFPLFAPKPATALIKANSSNKKKAVRWIRAREPGGLTNPIMSLRLALELKPDVVFLLTDGEVDDPEQVRKIIKDNNVRTTIHTIAFENEDGANTLERIAKENRGSFRFVR